MQAQGGRAAKQAPDSPRASREAACGKKQHYPGYRDGPSLRGQISIRKEATDIVNSS